METIKVPTSINPNIDKIQNSIPLDPAPPNPAQAKVTIGALPGEPSPAARTRPNCRPAPTPKPGIQILPPGSPGIVPPPSHLSKPKRVVQLKRELFNQALAYSIVSLFVLLTLPFMRLLA